jgi:hypothetical protein
VSKLAGSIVLSSAAIARRRSNVAEKEARSILGWHALSLRRAWRRCPYYSTPFEDSGRATRATLLFGRPVNPPVRARSHRYHSPRG